MKQVLAILTMLCFGVLSAQTYHIGDVYTAPDGSQGIVYYLHPNGSGGWVVALNDASTGCAWGDTTDVSGLSNQSSSSVQLLLNDTTGYANTLTIRNYQNNSTTYAAGKVDFSNGWVLPSPAQLSMLYGQLPFISSAITSAGGTVLAYDLYWCSAEYDAIYAVGVDFGGDYFLEGGYYSGGFYSCLSKISTYRVRAVRSFSNTSVVYDTALTYQWNTGSTQPYINVSPSQTTTYTVTGTTEFGCSNTAEQTIIVGTGTPQTFYDTVCQGAGYEANGFTLTESETDTVGTLTLTRPLETEGCSSELTLWLTVNPTVTSTSSATACGSYIWNGVTYYESGTYTQHFTAENGCDSTVTLLLTISDATEVSVTATADTVCSGGNVTLQASATNAVVPPPLAVGDILCTDGTTVKPSAFTASGKTALGVVFYVDNTGEHGWAVHLDDQSTGIFWTPAGQFEDIPALNNYTEPRDAIMDLDGYSNTQKIRNAGDASRYPAAYAVDFDNGWYLPAAGQLRLLMAETLTLNQSLQVVNGTLFRVNEYYFYWSSTEYGLNRVWEVSDTGNTSHYDKNTANIEYIGVRSIRNF